MQQVLFNLGNRNYQSTRTWKTAIKSYSDTNIFTVPGLESEIWQNVRFRPNLYTTCQNLNWKKTRVTIYSEINFLFVRFLFVFWFRKSQSDELSLENWDLYLEFFSKKSDSGQNYFGKITFWLNWLCKSDRNFNSCAILRNMILHQTFSKKSHFA